jgi:hypothetical protein
VPISGTNLGTVRIPFTLNDLEVDEALWRRGDAFSFTYLRSITECAADKWSAKMA